MVTPTLLDFSFSCIRTKQSLPMLCHLRNHPFCGNAHTKNWPIKRAHVTKYQSSKVGQLFSVDNISQLLSVTCHAHYRAEFGSSMANVQAYTWRSTRKKCPSYLAFQGHSFSVKNRKRSPVPVYSLHPPTLGT